MGRGLTELLALSPTTDYGRARHQRRPKAKSPGRCQGFEEFACRHSEAAVSTRCFQTFVTGGITHEPSMMEGLFSSGQ